MNFLSLIGASVLRTLRGWGHAGFFFAELLASVPAALRRFMLVIVQLHEGADQRQEVHALSP